MPRKDLNKKLLKRAEEEDRVIPWSELTQKRFYQVISVSTAFENKYGESHILTLEDLTNDRRLKVYIKITC